LAAGETIDARTPLPVVFASLYEALAANMFVPQFSTGENHEHGIETLEDRDAKPANCGLGDGRKRTRFRSGKEETIDATAYGTSTQLGRNIGITLIIYDWSTPEDRQILVDAFQKGQNQGLVNALQKMKAVGRINIPSTLGYDVSFIRLIPTPTGRKIRFVTNRKIAFAEAYADSQSQSFDLTAGEFDLNDQDKSKSTGVLYPACQFTINKDGELQIELNQNAWRLSNFIDWKGTAEN
jgi:hypothetical protein